MDARFTLLLDAIHEVSNGEPANLGAFLCSLPEVGVLPSPWEAWTLIALVRHRDRQLWVAEIVETRLRGDLSELGSIGGLGHPEKVPQRGSVPGIPDWEYYFHGRGCCLTHKVKGDQIDVDFWGDSAEYFDTFFYTNYLESLRVPEPVEQRLIELHPSLRPVSMSIADLVVGGALTPLPDREEHPNRVSDEVLNQSETIKKFCHAWADPQRRLWLAALIGDWTAALEAAKGQKDLEHMISPRAVRCSELRHQKLKRQITSKSRAMEALWGLADMNATDLTRTLEEALRQPPSGLVSAALAIIKKQNEPQWCPQIFDLFSRLNPSGQYPEPNIWMNCLKFLLQHKYRKSEVLDALPSAGAAEVGEAVLLALEHAHPSALPLARRSLLSKVPRNRIKVAAILALIGKSWSKREMLAALEGCDDQELTAEIRIALLETGDEEIQRLVLAWEERNPHENELGSYLEIRGRRLGPFYSGAELYLKNCAQLVRYEMEQLFERVRGLKEHLLPGSD